MAPLGLAFRRHQDGALEGQISSVAGGAPFVTGNTSSSLSSPACTGKETAPQPLLNTLDADNSPKQRNSLPKGKPSLQGTGGNRQEKDERKAEKNERKRNKKGNQSQKNSPGPPAPAPLPPPPPPVTFGSTSQAATSTVTTSSTFSDSFSITSPPGDVLPTTSEPEITSTPVLTIVNSLTTSVAATSSATSPPNTPAIAGGSNEGLPHQTTAPPDNISPAPDSTIFSSTNTQTGDTAPCTLTPVAAPPSGPVITSDSPVSMSSVALGTQVSSSTVPFPTAGVAALGNSAGSSTRTKALIGSAIGGAIVLLALGILTRVLLRRRRRAEERAVFSTPEPYTQLPSPRDNVVAHFRPSSFGERMVFPIAAKADPKATIKRIFSTNGQRRKLPPSDEHNPGYPSGSSDNNSSVTSAGNPFADPPLHNPFDDVALDDPCRIPVPVLERGGLPKLHEVRGDMRRLGPVISPVHSATSGQSTLTTQYGYAI